MKLTPQDQLALALTSAGSMRNLAALVGVSHQKIGRWLREGHPDGVKVIPKEAHAAIAQAYSIHRDLARQQARVDNLPFDSRAPVYMERKPLRTGEKGDRVFAEHTHFIRSGLRQEVIWNAQQSRRFMQVSIRSTVDMARYARRIAEQEHKAKRHGSISLAKLTKYVQAGLEKRAANEIRAGVSPQPIFTKYANISPAMGDRTQGVMTAESLLRRKHEPATTQAIEGEARPIPGTKLADQLLFQLLPAKRNANQSPTKRTTQSKKATNARRSTVARKPGR